MAITDYTYRKLRKIVKDSTVGVGVKNMFNAALYEYRHCSVKPVRGEFFTGHDTGFKACIVGAALCSATGCYPPRNASYLYPEHSAASYWGLTERTIDSIVIGFDNGFGENISGEKFKDNGKVASLARKVGKIIFNES